MQASRLLLATVESAALFPTIEFLVSALKRRAHSAALQDALGALDLSASWLCAALLRATLARVTEASLPRVWYALFPRRDALALSGCASRTPLRLG